jgi:hypothetical protein
VMYSAGFVVVFSLMLFLCSWLCNLLSTSCHFKNLMCTCTCELQLMFIPKYIFGRALIPARVNGLQSVWVKEEFSVAQITKTWQEIPRTHVPKHSY